jgi:hypothetical protein
MNEQLVPVRPAAVGFPQAPTHEPMVAAVLVTLDPRDGQLRTYVRTGRGCTGPAPDVLELLTTHLAIRNLPEVAP